MNKDHSHVDDKVLFKAWFFCLLIFWCIFISMPIKLTTKEFIKKANIVHNNKFNYPNEYIGSKIRLIIECPIHGLFKQKPNDHLTGHDCPKCSNKYKPTSEEFINKANIIHNSKYLYLSEYISNKTKIDIKCPIHGLFQQSPHNHLKGQGCFKCGNISKLLTTNEFTEKAKLKHGGKYDYSLVEYKNNKDKIKIICKIHGQFVQSPQSHLEGNGCVKCRIPLISDFIKKARKIHGNVYDYTGVNYINSKTKIDILCTQHGVFKQKLNDHLYGNGCPFCKESKGEKEIRNYLINLNISFKSQKKYSDCKYINELPFDFYLPDYNTCIEYNGVQHYEYRKFFHRTKESFYIQQLKDKIKFNYCKDNDIKLIVIKYNENIVNKLNEFII